TQRRSLAASERATEEHTQTVSLQGRNVGDQIDKLVAAGNQLVSGANALGTLLDQADAQYNAGNPRGAAADVDNRGRPTLNEVQDLAGRESQSLTEAHDAEQKLPGGLSVTPRTRHPCRSLRRPDRRTWQSRPESADGTSCSQRRPSSCSASASPSSSSDAPPSRTPTAIAMPSASS